MVTPGVISILEQSTNMRYNDRALYTKPTNYAPRYVQRFSVSYVTGTHAYKVGVQNEAGSQKTTNSVLYPGNVSYSFNNQVPVQLTQYATPYTIFSRYRWDLGLFVQDQWSLKKLTLNYGVRYEYFNGPCRASTWTRTQRLDPGARFSMPSRTRRTGRTCPHASGRPTTCLATARRR